MSTINEKLHLAQQILGYQFMDTQLLRSAITHPSAVEGRPVSASYERLEFLFSPDQFVVGGGVSKHADHFLPLLKLDTPIIPAVHRNNAGILGAAALAAGPAERIA